MREKKRVQKVIGESHEKLIKRMEEKIAGSGQKVPYVSNLKKKMSEVIIEYARPFIDKTADFEEQRLVLTVAILIWNRTITFRDNQELLLKNIEELKEVLLKAAADSHFALDIFELLAKRKQTFFPDINRLIIDYDIADTPDGCHLNVASMPF